MLTIVNIDENSVLLSDEDTGFRSRYINNESGRMIVQFLTRNNQELWDVILAHWATEPTTGPNINEPTFDELRLQKQQIIKKWCYNKIIEGISIDLGLVDDSGNPLGELHYTLTERQQSDMRDLALMITKGATQVTWRDDSRVSHMIYTAEQFMNLYQAATIFILQCRFRSDALETLLFSYSDDRIDLVTALTWDTELPETIQNQMNKLLEIMLKQTGENNESLS